MDLMDDVTISWLFTCLTIAIASILITVTVYTKKMLAIQSKYEQTKKHQEIICDWATKSECADEYLELIFSLDKKNN